MGKIKKYQKGEIVTLIAIGTVVVLGISSIISSVFLTKTKTTTNTKAEGTCADQHLCTIKDTGACGQYCDNLAKCDISGGCNPACCVANSDCAASQQCNISNGYCGGSTTGNGNGSAGKSCNDVAPTLTPTPVTGTPSPPPNDPCGAKGGTYYPECCSKGFERHVCNVKGTYYCDDGSGTFNSICDTNNGPDGWSCRFEKASCGGPDKSTCKTETNGQCRISCQSNETLDTSHKCADATYNKCCLPGGGGGSPTVSPPPTQSDCVKHGNTCEEKYGNPANTCLNAVGDQSKAVSYSCNNTSLVCCTPEGPTPSIGPSNTCTSHSGYTCNEKQGNAASTCSNAIGPNSTPASYTCSSTNEVCCSPETKTTISPPPNGSKCTSANQSCSQQVTVACSASEGGGTKTCTATKCNDQLSCANTLTKCSACSGSNTPTTCNNGVNPNSCSGGPGYQGSCCTGYICSSTTGGSCSKQTQNPTNPTTIPNVNESNCVPTTCGAAAYYLTMNAQQRAKVIYQKKDNDPKHPAYYLDQDLCTTRINDLIGYCSGTSNGVYPNLSNEWSGTVHVSVVKTNLRKIDTTQPVQVSYASYQGSRPLLGDWPIYETLGTTDIDKDKLNQGYEVEGVLNGVKTETDNLSFIGWVRLTYMGESEASSYPSEVYIMNKDTSKNIRVVVIF